MSVTNLQKRSEDSVLATLQTANRLIQRNKSIEAVTELEKVLSECEYVSRESHLKVAQTVAQVGNEIAVEKGQVQAARYMRLAESVLQTVFAKYGELDEEFLRLRVLTYNNWATYHKTRKNYHMALNYLMRAGQLTKTLSHDPDTLEYAAKTRLNTSALYSELRRFHEAIDYSEQCLTILQAELNIRLNGKLLDNLGADERERFDTMMLTYVTAFYNIGIAEEALGHSSKATSAYRNALHIGTQFLPPTHEIISLAKRAISSSQLLPQSQPTSPRHLASPTSLSSPISFPGTFITDEDQQEAGNTGEEHKYYTAERLAALQARLQSKKDTDFVTADKFFFAKISSALNVSQDLKRMRPLSA